MSYSRTTVQGFTPHLFIGIGETCAFYTLRETYLHETFIRGAGPMGGAVVNGVYQGTVSREVRSFHHQNLSQDAAEAIEKAEMIARRMGMDLRGATLEKIEREMRDIHRRDEEQMRAARTQAAWDAVYRQDTVFDPQIMDGLTRTHRCTFVFGKYAGKTFAEVNEFDRDYLEFMARDDAYGRDEEMELRRLSLETFLENHAPALVLNDDHFGTIGTRYDIDLTVTFVRPVQSYYGMSLLIKGHDADGHRFTTFYSGNKFDPKVGETYSLKATVKDHDDYDGINQTMLTRIAVQS